MNYRILPTVLAIACAAAEEAVPAPAPAPAPAAPAVAPAAAAQAAATPPPAPTSAPPAPHSARGVRVARVAGAAPEWDGYVRESAAWDSNALLDNDPDRSSAATAVYSTEAGVGWRPVASESDYLKAAFTAGHDIRPHLVDSDTTRLGLSASYAHQAGGTTLGASLGLTRYWLDGKGAAAELRGGLIYGWLHQASADLASLEIGALHFDDAGDRPDRVESLASLGSADDRSGALAALGYRHWWLVNGQGLRVEAGARAGRYFADSDIETYDLVQPFVGARWRPSAWEFQARAGLELRSYAGAAAGSSDERSSTGTINASADRRLGGGLAAGVFAAASARDSSLDGRDYERWQAGLRLTWSYSPEEE